MFYGTLFMVLALNLWLPGVAPALAAQRTLYIGDSHSVGAFGYEIETKLRAIPEAEVGFYASCGSRPSSWLAGSGGGCGYRSRDTHGVSFTRAYHAPDKTTADREGKRVAGRADPIPQLKGLLNQVKPSLTVIELGGNLIRAFDERNGRSDDAMPCQPNRDAVEKSVRAMIEQVRERGSRCVWIGPPHSRAFIQRCFQEVYDLLTSVTAESGCELIDTRPFAFYPDLKVPGRLNRKMDGDGLHYDSLPGGAELARNLARRVFERLEPLLNLDQTAVPNARGTAAEEPEKVLKDPDPSSTAAVSLQIRQPVSVTNPAQ